MMTTKEYIAGVLHLVHREYGRIVQTISLEPLALGAMRLRWYTDFIPSEHGYIVKAWPIYQVP